MNFDHLDHIEILKWINHNNNTQMLLITQIKLF
jgi:hypothetical protein